MPKTNLLRPITLFSDSGLCPAGHIKNRLFYVFLGLEVGAALSKLSSEFQKCAIFWQSWEEIEKKNVRFLRFGDKG